MEKLNADSLLFFDPTLQLITHNGNTYTQFESVGREINSLSNRVSDLYVSGQQRDGEPGEISFKISSDISFLPLPYWSENGDKSGFLKNIYWTGPFVRELIIQTEIELLFVRSGPHPASIIAAKYANKSDSQSIFFIGSDFKQNTFYRTSDDRLVKRFTERTFASIVDSCVRTRAKNADGVFLHPGHLEEKYDINQNTQTVLLSPISETEIASKTDKPQDDRIEILYVGGLSSPKGVDNLVRSFSIVRDSLEEEVDVSLTIRGTGGDQEKIEKIACELGIEEKLNFLPYLPYGELLDKYKSADIFVLPSRQEGQGRVLIEALGSGCAVVGSDVGGIPEIITHKENGLLVEPDDVQDLADSIIFLISNPNKMDELRCNGIQWAQNHTLESSTDQFVEFANTLLPK